jgi:hypothetical protein
MTVLAQLTKEKVRLCQLLSCPIHLRTGLPEEHLRTRGHGESLTGFGRTDPLGQCHACVSVDLQVQTGAIVLEGGHCP